VSHFSKKLSDQWGTQKQTEALVPRPGDAMTPRRLAPSSAVGIPTQPTSVASSIAVASCVIRDQIVRPTICDSTPASGIALLKGRNPRERGAT